MASKTTASFCRAFLVSSAFLRLTKSVPEVVVSAPEVVQRRAGVSSTKNVWWFFLTQTRHLKIKQLYRQLLLLFHLIVAEAPPWNNFISRKILLILGCVLLRGLSYTLVFIHCLQLEIIERWYTHINGATIVVSGSDCEEEEALSGTG